MGGRAIGAGEFHLQNYFVSEEDLLAPPIEAFKKAMELINGARAYVAAMCCGIMQSSLDHALTYGAGRESFGRPVIDHQGLRWSLVDVATDIEALRALTRQAGECIDSGEDACFPAAYAKKFAGRATLPAVTACIQAMGANGLKRQFPLGRHLASAKIAAFTDGSTEMMNERIGAGLVSGI
jgi:alkylation response protein AidB-like acyl-CoA dehydrogenase